MTTITVSSGVTSSGLTVSSGNELLVLSGGIAETMTVLSGGTMILSSGAIGSSLAISAGGKLDGAGEWAGEGYSYGQVSGVTVGDSAETHAGYLEVAFGGSASGVTVAYGWLQVDPGATATGTVLSGISAVEYVEGVASGTVVDSGGVDNVLSAAEAVSAVIHSGGREFVSSGGSTSVSVVQSGGSLTLSAGAVGSLLTISAGGKLVGAGELVNYISEDAGQVSGVMLGQTAETDAGYLEVQSGGSASGVSIDYGYLELDAGGTTTGTVVSGSESTNFVFGVASGTFRFRRQ